MCFISAAEPLKTLYPETYLMQNTHTAFLMAGENDLISDCSFFRDFNICRFRFESSKGFKSEISVPYESLKVLHHDILGSLQNLKNQWEAEYPIYGIYRLHPTRSQDHENLSLLIHELEVENLPLRVLQPVNDNRTLAAAIYSRERAEQIYAIFWHHIKNSGQSQCLRDCIQPQI